MNTPKRDWLRRGPEVEFNLAVLPGDGIGPEIIEETVKVLGAVGRRFGHGFNLNYGLVGGVAIEKEGAARY